jgi:hypothetical protein
LLIQITPPQPESLLFNYFREPCNHPNLHAACGAHGSGEDSSQKAMTESHLDSNVSWLWALQASELFSAVI